MINAILDLAKIEYVTIELRNKPFDVSDAFEKGYLRFKNMNNNPNIEIKAENKLGSYIISADKNRFQDPIRADTIWIVDHSQHCSDIDVTVVC